MSSSVKVDKNMYSITNIAFAYQILMNISDAVPPEDFILQFTDSEPSFPVTLQDFTDPTSDLESLAKDPKY